MMKKNIVAVALMLTPVVGFTQSDAGAIKAQERQAQASHNAALTELLDASIATIRGTSSVQNRYAKKNPDSSKINALKGTWIISYLIDGVNYTDQLDVSDIKNEGGDFSGQGYIYEAIIFKGLAAVCRYEPALIKSNQIDNDYFCITSSDGYTNLYSFNINTVNNTLTGFYGIGLGTNEALAAIKKTAVDIVGYRQPLECAARYDNASRILDIPCVTYLNNTYSAKLIDTAGNFNFSLKSAAPK
jgi:hypothetical protein